MDVVDTHPRHRASVALRRLLGEVWILVAEPVVLVILGTAIALCAAVGFINAATSHEVQPALTSIQTQLDEVAAAQRRGEVEIDGSLLEPLQRSLEAVRERAELDLHYGSLLGVAEAILGLLTTGLGAAMGVTIGAVTVGRDFERRTWFHELVNAPSRRSAIANKAVAGLGLMVMVAVIGSITAVGAALLAHIVLGGLVVGTVRAVLIPQAIVFLLSATLWVLLGFVGALVTCRSGGGAAAAGFVVLADAAISLNLSRWARWMITARVAGISRLWAPISDVFVNTGETTSVVWWGTFEQVGTYNVADGAVAITVFVCGFWLLTRIFVRYLPATPST